MKKNENMKKKKKKKLPLTLDGQIDLKKVTMKGNNNNTWKNIIFKDIIRSGSNYGKPTKAALERQV